MADTDAARIGDVKAGFVAAKSDANARLKRDGSNVQMTEAEAGAFRAAIGAEAAGGGGGVVFATVAEVRAGAVDGKVISPKVAAEAVANVAIPRADAALGINFDTFINASISLDANGTLGVPSGGKPQKSGIITIINASGTASLVLAAGYRQPIGGITIAPGVNSATRIGYSFGGAGVVNVWPAAKWNA